jgi:hypothetical protein
VRHTPLLKERDPHLADKEKTVFHKETDPPRCAGCLPVARWSGRFVRAAPPVPVLDGIQRGLPGGAVEALQRGIMVSDPQVC